MATKLKSFEFRSCPKWNWAELLDGSIWQLKKGIDFDRDADRVASTLRTGAGVKGKGLSLKIVNSSTIVLQAREKRTRSK